MKTYKIELYIDCEAKSKIDIWAGIGAIWNKIESTIKNDLPEIRLVDGDVLLSEVDNSDSVDEE